MQVKSIFCWQLLYADVECKFSNHKGSKILRFLKLKKEQIIKTGIDNHSKRNLARSRMYFTMRGWIRNKGI